MITTPSFIVQQSIIAKQIMDMVKEFPNDADLGGAVRQLIIKHIDEVTAYYKDYPHRQKDKTND